MITNQGNQESTHDTEGRQGNAKEAEDQLACSRENQNDHEAYNQRLRGDLAPGLGIGFSGKPQKHGGVGNRIHNGEESHEYRKGMANEGVHGDNYLLIRNQNGLYRWILD